LEGVGRGGDRGRHNKGIVYHEVKLSKHKEMKTENKLHISEMGKN